MKRRRLLITGVLLLLGGAIVNVAVTARSIAWPVASLSESQDRICDVEAFIDAARKGEATVVSECLRQGIRPNVKSKWGDTALCAAAGNPKATKCVQLLLNSGADPNLKAWKSPLANAVRAIHVEAIPLLLAAGCEINAAADSSLRTPAHYSLDFNDTALRSIDAQWYFAQLSNRFKIISNLCDSGANINQADAEGTTPFLLACGCGEPEIVELLIRRGADVHAQPRAGAKAGQTSLMFASIANDIESCRMLLDAGVQIDQRDGDGNTAIMLAARFHRESTVRFLISVHAELNLKNDSGQTALLLAAANHGDTNNVVALLVSAGAEANVVDANGFTPLMHSIAARRGRDVGLLLRNGADCSVRTTDGDTAMVLAVKSLNCPRYYGIIDSYRNAAAKDGLERKHYEAAATSYANGLDRDRFAVRQIVEILLGAGCEVNGQNIKGESALTIAVKQADVESLKLLMQGGARVPPGSENSLTELARSRTDPFGPAIVHELDPTNSPP